MTKHLFSTVFALALFAYVFSITACESPEPENNSVQIGDTLKINLTYIPVLASGYKYQIWLVTSDSKLISVDTFSIPADLNDPNTTFRAYTGKFRVGADTLSKATVCFLSIENTEQGKPTTPSNTRMLAGTFSSEVTDLVMNHDSAFGVNFITQLKATAMKYRIDQFTGSGANDTSASGVWLIDTTNQASPAWKSGISPSLPSLARGGWKYEGWLIKNGHLLALDKRTVFPLSLGKFTSATGADENANSFGGANKDKAPAFPGEDFLTNTPEGYNAVIGKNFPSPIVKADIVSISIEPNVNGKDDSPKTFSFTAFASLMAELTLAEANFDYVLKKGQYFTATYVVGQNPRVPEYKGTASRAK